MNQSEVLAWFKRRRAAGRNVPLSHIEIYRAMKREGYEVSYNSLNRMIRALYKAGLLESNIDQPVIVRVKYRFPEESGRVEPFTVDHPELFASRGRAPHG